MAEETQVQETSSQASGAPVYEVGFHLVPTIGEDGVAPALDKIRSVLGNAEIIKEQFPTKLQFAYTIERSVQGKREKYNEGYFGWIKFAIERELVGSIEQALRSTREVLRYLLVETVREEIVSPRRAIFTSDRLEGQTLKKPTSAPETPTEVSDEELDKSIEALVQ